MSDVIDLQARRKPVSYAVEIRHHWDDSLEVFVHDVSEDDRSRRSVADALYRAAEMFGYRPTPSPASMPQTGGEA